ncbi:MAG: DNA polymerase IV [Bacteriovoracaceae bacterium]
MRKFIHIDMDCFFAAVEMREDPTLRDIPMAVGGSPEGRGVISTSNYPARKFGVRSGISSAMAMKLCPHLKIVSHSFHSYKAEAEKIHEIFYDYTDLVEIAGLDEAYLDVTDSPLFNGSATLIARDIKRRIFEATQLTASAGVAPNMFLAKVASDWNKPNGLFVIRPQDVDAFSLNLPVGKIPGVGKVSEAKMHALGIKTCADLRKMPLHELQLHFGKWASSLRERAYGRSDREICLEYERKSLSTEETFAKDLSYSELEGGALQTVIEEFERRYKKFRLREPDWPYPPHTLFLKLKFHDFVNVSVQKSLPVEAFDYLNTEHKLDDDLFHQLCDLLKMAYNRGKRPARLLGIGIRFAQDPQTERQLSLFDQQTLENLVELNFASHHQSTLHRSRAS